MTPQQVHDLVLNKTHEYVKDFNFTGFEAVIFDDVCESIAKSNTTENLTRDGIILAVITAFQTSQEIARRAISSLLGEVNTVSLNYGQHAFKFNKDSIF
ncbi:MAG: hypothetical protein JO072_15460 [Parafilimonas sp.]|nr:hypothetical protein [Parafilimonas sp.]